MDAENDTNDDDVSERELELALSTINEILGPDLREDLITGLPDGQCPYWGFDRRLVVDIADAIDSWSKRR
jgi:hypothetical protein